jgi:signal transduction histidine kinase
MRTTLLDLNGDVPLRRSIAAAEEERRRWARELHDETLQGLAGLRVMLSTARRGHDVAALHAALDTAVAQLTDEIVNLRSLITELRPAALDELGLQPALATLIGRARATHGIEIEASIELRQRSRLDPDTETAIYRVIQESLSNAIRHAKPELIEIEVVERDEDIQLELRDDGLGFDVDAASHGFGLTGMRERIALAGGRLEITSSPEGTTISARLPSAR